MIIIPELTNEYIDLNAYSYQEKEFDIVRRFFDRTEIRYTTREIRKDAYERRGIAFRIDGVMQIRRLQNTIGISFFKFGNKTGIEIGEGSGDNYHCVRLKSFPLDNGCVDIVADNGEAAFLKCAIIANERNWFGAESIKGRCKDK